MARAFDPADSCFRVDEVVFLIDVKFLVVPAVAFLIELVIYAGSLIADMAVLQVRERLEVSCEGVSRFDISASVKLCGIRIVVFVISSGKELVCHPLIFDVGQIAIVVAFKILKRETAHDIQGLS